MDHQREPPGQAHEAGQPRDIRPRWWAEHAAREPDAGMAPDQRPTPFRSGIARRVPNAAVQGRAVGRLDRHDGSGSLPIASGSRTGLTDALRTNLGYLPVGFTRQNMTHVEAHAAAYLRLHPNITNATLYINRIPCPGPRGCLANLPAMLPGGVTLTVYAPNGWMSVYRGSPDP